MELDVEIFVMITYTHVNIEFGPCVHTYTQFSERCLYHVDKDVVGATLRRSNSKHTRETRHFAEKKCSSLAFSSSSTTMPPSAQQKKNYNLFDITFFTASPHPRLPPSSKSKTRTTANVNLHSACSNSVLAIDDEAKRQAQCARWLLLLLRGASE